MKIIIVIILLLSAQAFSQVTLNSSYSPAAGNSDAYLMCDTNNIVQGPAGANLTWNFSSLTFQDTSEVHFVNAGSTPYASQFPSSNIASTADDTTYNYMTSSQSNLLVNGFAGPDFVLPYTNAQLYMQYPFTYTSSFNDAFSGSYDLGGTMTYRNGTTAVTGNAWGTINLPAGSFPNAIRVKYEIETSDSSNPGISFVIVTHTTSYVWFVPGRKFPVFEIIYTSITFNGSPFGSSKVVNYNITNTPIGISNISGEMPVSYDLTQNYPNPFNPSTTIKFSIPVAGHAKMVVTEVSGKEIERLVDEQLPAGKYSVVWNPKSYSSGVYFYTLNVNGFTETKRMILLK